MAIAFVQNLDFNGSTSSSSYTPAYTSAVTSGNLLIALIYPSGTTSVSSVTDSLSQTWTQIAGASGTTTSSAYIYYQKNTAGGACTVTVTLGAAANCNIIIYEFSGCDTAAPLDQSNTTVTTSSTATTSGNVTTTVADELLIGGAHCGLNATAGEAGWTAIAPTTRGNLAEYIIVSSTQTVAATGTQTAAANSRGNIATFKVASAGGTTWNATATISSLTSIPTETATKAAGAIATVYSQFNISGTGQGGGTWNGENKADVWSSSTSVWDSPDLFGAGDVWNSIGAFWNDTNAFWGSWGLPTAQAITQPVDLISASTVLASPINTWDSSGVFWNAATTVWDAYLPTAQAILQPTITLTSNVILTGWGLWDDPGITWSSATDVWNEHGPFAQAIHQATETIATHIRLSTEVAQAIHQATETIGLKITLTEVAQLLAQGTATISTKASATETGQAIHQATDTLHPFITLFATANVPTQGGNTWNVTAVIRLSVAASDSAQMIAQVASGLASQLTVTGPGRGGDLWNGMTTSWNSTSTVWDSSLATGDLWDSSTVPWNSTQNVWDSVGQPLAQVVAEPTSTMALQSILASPLNTWDSARDFWSDPFTVWNSYLPTAQAVHQATESIISRIALSETAQAILQPTLTAVLRAVLSETAQVLHQGTTTIAGKILVIDAALVARCATSQISPHLTLSLTAQGLHRALITLLSRASLIATVAGVSVNYPGVVVLKGLLISGTLTQQNVSGVLIDRNPDGSINLSSGFGA